MSVNGSAIEPPRDVLAAEAFGVPAADPAFKPVRLELPQDLVGGELRDVLVAEEFAMPAPPERGGSRPRAMPRASVVTGRGLGAAASFALAAAWVWAAARRRRRAGD